MKSKSSRNHSLKDVKHSVLIQALRARVPYGQEQFRLLLQASECRGGESGSAVDLGLEDLRYRWMLYKSKLKDAGDIRRRRSGAKVMSLFGHCS